MLGINVIIITAAFRKVQCKISPTYYNNTAMVREARTRPSCKWVSVPIIKREENKTVLFSIALLIALISEGRGLLIDRRACESRSNSRLVNEENVSAINTFVHVVYIVKRIIFSLRVSGDDTFEKN